MAERPVRPMKLGMIPAPASVRDPSGRFAALPPNPLDTDRPQRWAPGIGLGTARTFDKPLPMTPAFDPGNHPMKNLRQR